MRSIQLYTPIFLIICCISGQLQGQKKADYFQQKVNTTINVTLNDKKNQLIGTAYLEYYNNSPDTLTQIYFHLWANAFRDKQSGFARQQLRNKKVSFYFAEDEHLGGYDSLEFYIDGTRAPWRFNEKYKDIAHVSLQKHLAPGEMISLAIPFQISIPVNFSRFGREGESYQITQWFPKPAVYDNQGWHPMPYLDLGEFYSEFGDYDVTITLPEDYYVAATGELLTRSEHQRINQRVSQTESDNSPVNSTLSGTPDPSTKTIRFIAENVHDFAWFADKRFLIRERIISLPSGDSILGQVFYLPEEAKNWENSLDYVERGLRFYIEKVGSYPYPKVAVVQGKLGAGSGMEYPMITVIGPGVGGEPLDQVITHEIGHNWFYGVLGFNERDYPWLDEGINSFYDHRYTRLFYDKSEYENIPGFIKQLITADWYSLYHAMASHKALIQPSDLPSQDFNLNNYLLGAYENPAMALEYLSAYMGIDAFDQMMQSFYEKWQYKHPGPTDLREHFETFTKKDLSWFFETMIGQTRVFDYGISSVQTIGKEHIVTLKNNTGHSIPVQLSMFIENKPVESLWIEGFKQDTTLYLVLDSIDRFILDHQQLYTDLNRKDNTYPIKWRIFKTKPSLRFLDVFDDPSRSQASWLPSVGWNKSDGFMAGLMIFNHTLPQNNLQVLAHPLIAFGAEDNNSWLTGMGKISYDWYRDDDLRNIRFSLSTKSFHYDLPNDKQLRYIANKGEIRFRFNKDLTDNRYFDLILSQHTISNERFIYSIEEYVDEIGHVSRLSMEQFDNNKLSPLNWETELELGIFEDFYQVEHHNYLKLSGELSSFFRYGPDKKIDFRIYAGAFLWRSEPRSTITQPGTIGLVGYAANDYLYEDYFFDRGTQDGFWSHQINLKGGGFKTAVSTAYNLGQSNQYVAALNMKADLPFDIPVISSLKPFLDLGFYGYLPTLSEAYQNRFLYSAGLMFESYEGALNLYFPIFNSDVIQNIYRENNSFLDRLSFSVNLHLFDFTRLLDRDDLLYGQ